MLSGQQLRDLLLSGPNSVKASAAFVQQELDKRAGAVTFAQMGGLEIDTTYNTAADHTDFTATVGKLYLIDLSAMTGANFVVDLPDTAKVGENIGFYITVGDADFELEIRTASTGSLFQGVDTSAGSTLWRLFITGEQLIAGCIKAGGVGDTDWRAAYDGRIPCRGLISLTSDSPTLTASTEYAFSGIDGNGSEVP